MSRGIGTYNALVGLRKTSDRVWTTDDMATPLLNLGTVVELEDGRKFKFIRATEALAIGEVVTLLAPHVSGTATSAASDNTLTDTGAFTASYYNDPYGEYYVATTGGTGVGQVRRILTNTADVLTLDAAWTTAISTDTTHAIVSPHLVELADAANEKVAGVAIGTISANQYGWIQTKGFCPLIKVAGDSDALAAHEGLVSSGTAGVAKGLTGGGTTADEADKAFGYVLYAYSTAAAAAKGVCGVLNRCEG